MGMTKLKAIAVLKFAQIDESTPHQNRINAYKREALLCDVDKLSFPKEANASQRNALIIAAQKRFIEVTHAFRVLMCELREEKEEEKEAAALHGTETQNQFWFQDLTFDDPEIESVYKKLFLSRIDSFTKKEAPHPYFFSYTCKGYQTVSGIFSFSNQKQLIKYCNNLLTIKGHLTFHVLNFPREWLKNVQNMLRGNDNLTQISFPSGYHVLDALEWIPIVKRSYLEPERKPSMFEKFNKKISHLSQNNKSLLAGVIAFGTVTLILGGFILPLLFGLSVGVSTKVTLKVLNNAREYYTDRKIKELEKDVHGQPVAQAFHLGETASKGFKPFAEVVLNPTIIKKPCHFEAFLAGVQKGCDAKGARP
jgi:hypothetical protein